MDGGDRVRVFARVRPSTAASASCVEADGAARAVRVRGDACHTGEAFTEARGFAFDAVFSPEAPQREVFAQAGLPVLQECLRGFNGCILAYGQTGSGKTHSLLHQGECLEEAGLLPRVAASLFVHVAQDVANAYEIEAAAVQVYKEQVDDLLHPEHSAGGGLGLGVQNGGVIPGLTWVKCLHPQTLLDAFASARSNLVYAETNMNKASSRSHAVFQIRITKHQRVSPTAVASSDDESGGDSPMRVACTHARLSIVDLAGSERIKKSGVEGTQLKEATAINRSLLAFGNVVSALAARRAHVPTRDSKLTRILDGSIGGNCKTALLVCINPAAEHVAESVSTLEFASRAMRVEVVAKINTGSIEVSAGARFEDLTGNLEELGVSLGCEMAALREQAQAAADRAERSEAEARRREAAIVEAEGEGQRWRVAAEEAERRAADAEEQAARLRKELAAAVIREEELRLRAESVEEVVRRLEAANSELQLHSQRLEGRCAELEAQVPAASAEAERAALREEDARVALARCRSDLEAQSVELRATAQERDAALQRAEKAEADLEEELDALASEVEASAEREAERQREAYEAMAEERRQAAEALQATRAEVALWRERAADAGRRTEALELELQERTTALEASLAAGPVVEVAEEAAHECGPGASEAAAAEEEEEPTEDTEDPPSRKGCVRLSSSGARRLSHPGLVLAVQHKRRRRRRRNQAALAGA